MLITGANRGMGRHFAMEAAKRGAYLHLPMRKLTEELKQELTSLGAKEVLLYELDLADPEGVDRLVSQLQYPIHVLINNAGQLTGGLLEEQEPESIQSMLQVNVMALIRLTRLLLPPMLEGGRGKIVNNASVSGVMNMPCASTYSASKAAVVAFTRCLEQELKGTGVSTLLLLTPGVKTEMYDQIHRDYGAHLELDFLSHVSSEHWAKRVFKHIESDVTECGPSAFSNRVGLWLAQHLPNVFNGIIQKRFRR